MAAYFNRRERLSAIWPGVHPQFKVADYLRRYDVIYERPADHWSEGLYVGNGVVGGVVTGNLRGRLSIGIDRADIWFATALEHPLGRGYACDLHLCCQPSGRFSQRLVIGEGTVHSAYGALRCKTYVDRKTSAVIVELRSSRTEKVRFRLERRPLPLLQGPLAALWNGSWDRVATAQQRRNHERDVRASARADICVQGQTLLCRAPNRTVVCTVCGDGRVRVRPRGQYIEGDVLLSKGKAVRIAVAVATSPSGEETKAIAAALHRGRQAVRNSFDNHRRAWETFWQRSFIRLGQPLQENLYYQGLYHMACTFAGNKAASFFGMTQPVDHRTWQDMHTSDAQTEMLTWAAYTSNHLAFTAPLLQTYAECWREQSEHARCPGGKVTHSFAPLEGGGHATLAMPQSVPYPFGSTAWHVLSYWQDFLYARDRSFLRKIAYPIMRSAADALLATMTRRNGVYHCFNSRSPEQDKTATDNIYDRVCVEALLKAVVAASEILQVDATERRTLRAVLRHLYPLPSDGRTILETMENPHPYRCHPVVLMGLYPLCLWREGMRAYALAQPTFDVLTNLFAFHYEDRHATIAGHTGGVEPNGHSTSFLLAFAARLQRPQDFDRLFDALVVGRQLKRNGLRSICDPRHSPRLEHMGIIEASSGQSAAIAERLLQSYPDRVHVFPCPGADRPARFAGLRAMGAFVLSGEWTGSRIAFVAVHALAEGVLNLQAPWQPGRIVWMKRGAVVTRFNGSVRMKHGETLLFSQERANLRTHSWRERSEPARHPVAIPVNTTDPHTVDVLFYPEDPPCGQEVWNGHIFLGNPANPPPPASPLWGEEEALRRAGDADPRVRQTAARVLGRHPTLSARKVLTKLVSDSDSVVAATAGVSLVRHGRRIPPAVLQRALRAAASGYVRREIEKASRRHARAD